MLAQEFGPVTGKRLEDLNQGDLWADTPFFAPGMEQDSENKRAWPVGVVIAGIFKGVRTKKDVGPKTTPTYGIFETLDGKKFRADAPGQLNHILTNATVGRYIEITYLGKEYVEKLEAECHQFSARGEVLN